MTRADAAAPNAASDNATIASVGTGGVAALNSQASESGNLRKRFPVAAAIAFASAGAIGGTPGSPTPVGFSVDGTMWTSIGGISLMRRI